MFFVVRARVYRGGPAPSVGSRRWRTVEGWVLRCAEDLLEGWLWP